MICVLSRDFAKIAKFRDVFCFLIYLILLDFFLRLSLLFVGGVYAQKVSCETPFWCHELVLCKPKGYIEIFYTSRPRFLEKNGALGVNFFLYAPLVYINRSLLGKSGHRREKSLYMPRRNPNNPPTVKKLCITIYCTLHFDTI